MLPGNRRHVRRVMLHANQRQVVFLRHPRGAVIGMQVAHHMLWRYVENRQQMSRGFAMEAHRVGRC